MDAEKTDRPRDRKRKVPRKISPRYLENAALHYLKRYAATEAGLRRVLKRKVSRSFRVHGGDEAQAAGWVDELVSKLTRNALLNDGAYAEGKARSLRSGGRSSRVIAQKLMLKGVPSALIAVKVKEAAAEVSDDEAALIWARKKRLGPFAKDPSVRKERRQKDLASLARAGFSFQVAKRIIDG